MAGDPADWLVGGKAMAAVIKAKDWSATALGPIASWPQSLRTTVSLVQASSSPISLIWGAGHNQIYNDGYWPICGAKHPMSMGQDFRTCWASAFPVIGEAYATAWSGHSAYLEKMRMFLDRHGFLEETWFTYSFSPITDESGRVGGLFHPVTEMTGQMLSERRTQVVRDVAIGAAGARTPEDALRLAADVLAQAYIEKKFSQLYLVDASGTRARRVARSGMSPSAAGPEVVELEAADPRWSISEAYRSGRTFEIDHVENHLVERVGPYPDMPRRAMVMPILPARQSGPAAILVAGVSARLALTGPYRMFFELVADAIGNALGNAHTLDDEHRKVEALAEIDRAKTAFFSNVSHEFRTPLTLILGPLEDELADSAGLPPARRERLDTMHRNSLRMLRLVNTLLDFSRIEAGRLRARYEPVDLAAETIELASVFRSAIETAGLTLTLRCPSLPEPIYIDREMWEKIVLNLMSNALKHTQRGGITIALHAAGDRAILRVIDTGVGIAPHELPRVFERFHRVQGAWSRSHEGTGIGLALVRELARALDAEVTIASTVDVGTVVSVIVKTGSAHLPADHVIVRTDHAPGRASVAFVEASMHGALASRDVRPAPNPGAPRVVWADDNADMRDYVTRLLADEFDVVPVTNGVEALAAVHAQLPDLVLSDVMMPELDGFGLVTALRADPYTQTVPVVLLSARAGAEATTAGIETGADDYLIKPFAARELLARVRTHVALGQTRRAWAAELERANKELEAFSYSVSHDLRAPLRAIDAFAEILIEEADTHDGQRRRDLLRRVLTGAKRMRAIIDDLLVLAQVSRDELRREPVNVTALARRILADLQVREPARTVEVTVNEGLTTTGDGRLIAIALENLLANAWKFTSKQPRAQITLDREGACVFAVRDNGAGFDMAHSQRLFEPFHRLHGLADFEGTGIGLAIVRRIVERHGGIVWAHGEVNRGATVRFTFEPTSQRHHD